MAGLRYAAEDGEKLFALGVSFTIGRDLHNDLVLHDQQVSRRHATIREHAGTYVLEDNGSRHGTYVQRGRHAELTRVKDSAVLVAQDVIRIGQARLVFDDKIHFRPEPNGAPTPSIEGPEVEELTGAFPPTQPGRVLPILFGQGAPVVNTPVGLDPYASVVSAMTARMEALEERVARLEALAAHGGGE